jgi:autotransporter translocation and assembly factor TamB
LIKKKVVIFFLVIFLLTAAVISLVKSPLTSRALGEYLASFLQRRLNILTAVEAVKIHILSPTLEIKGLSLFSHPAEETPPLHISRLKIAFRPWQLFAGQVSIKEISLFSPKIYLEIKDNKITNLPGYTHVSGKKEQSSGFSTISIDKFRVSEGKLILNKADRSILELTEINGELALAIDQDSYQVVFSAKLPLQSREHPGVPTGPASATKAELSAVVNGKLSSFSPSGTIRITDAAWGKLRLTELNSGYRLSRQGLELFDLSIRNPVGIVSGQSRIEFTENLDFQASLTLHDIELGELLRTLRAKYNQVVATIGGETELKGRLRNGFILKGEAELNLAPLKFLSGKEGESAKVVVGIEEVKVSSGLEIDREKLSISGVVNTGESTISVIGDFFKDRMHLDFYSDKFDYSTLSPIAGFPLEGKGELGGTIAVRQGRFFFNSKIDLPDLEFNRLELGSARGDIGYQSRVFFFSQMALKKRETPYYFDGKLNFGERFTLEADLRIPLGRVEDIIKIINEDSQKDFSGEIKAQARIAGEPRQLNGKGSIQVSSAKLLGAEFEQIAARMKLHEGNLILEDLILSQERGKLSGRGELSSEGRLDLELTGEDPTGKQFGWFKTEGRLSVRARSELLLKGEIGLYLLSMFSKAIAQAEGQASINARILERIASPKILGTVEIENGSLSLAKFPQTIKDISADIQFNQKGIVLRKFKAGLGEGTVKAGGMIGLRGFRFKGFDLAGELNGADFILSSWLPLGLEGRARLSGKINLNGSSGTPLLSGEANVQFATLSGIINWKSMLLDFRSRRHKPKPLLTDKERIGLDLRIRADDTIVVKFNLAETTVGGGVTIGGNLREINLKGDLEFTKGKIFYEDNEFAITSGIINFIGAQQINPYFDIASQTRAKLRDDEYQIYLNITGNLDDYKILLSSDPPLVEKDILSLLSFGFLSSELPEGAGSSRATYEAASLIAEELGAQERIEQVRKFVGLDTIKINPYYSDSSKTTRPRLTMSKELMKDFNITYSIGLEETRKQRVQLEYKLNKHFSLLGDWDNEEEEEKLGNLGADVKYRFEFR